ncbi:MAG: sensor histidine kinase [Halobacteriota archaeon]|nr:sensor histidine kinase [Halobacteriota archaeon]
MKGNYKFRPSARLIHTIGDDIIKDVYGAIVELVKNAYDADASKVELQFLDMIEPEKAKIVITDNGHGMSYETVINKWMIPATSDKSERRKSPNGRNMQGRKGIGRFATATLGDNLVMETTDEAENTTSIPIDWRIFNLDQYLDEIEIPIEVKHTGKQSGTKLIIKPAEKVSEWKEKTYGILITELRKLVSPIQINEDFEIHVELTNTGIEKYNNLKKKIEPIPLLDLFDYRLHGNIDEMGNGSLIFENQAGEHIPSEPIKLESVPDEGKKCGHISFDFRVFDRDPSAIEDLIKRGAKDPETGIFLGKREAMQLLNNICGIGIYRHGFRIRPYGDPAYDWLQLDTARVQNPSMKIGVNQIVGFINIASEEASHLEEKSARDGLKENDYYFGLVEIIRKCLSELETRRYDFRLETGRGRNPVKIKQGLHAIVDLEDLKKSIGNELKKSNTPENILPKIESVISEVEKKKTKSLENIEETIAMYEGQVTLGKIIMVIMHEGRKPLKYLKEQSPRIADWIREVQEEYSTDLLDKIIVRLENIKKETLLIIELFNRLDPLAVKKRGNRKSINATSIVERLEALYSNELTMQNIEFTNEVNEKFTFLGWEQDLYITLTNLVDNSIYWLAQTKNKKNKQITVSIKTEGDFIIIDFLDNGPGIDRKYIENNIIFEPGFTKKPEGTGLGLAIAGEAIGRSGGKLQAIYESKGAYFRIELPKGGVK